MSNYLEIKNKYETLLKEKEKLENELNDYNYSNIIDRNLFWI